MNGRLIPLVRTALAAAAVCAFIPSALFAGQRVDDDRHESSANDFARRVLASHNRERALLGLATLRWNPRLSQQAEQWASSLARRGAFEHSRDLGDTGENLWMGSANYYSPEQMVGTFLSERQAFRPGRFPQVSNTGRWSDVGHYTQIIWPQTQDVGCAVARSGGLDVMVCRYWPAGNVRGQPVG